MIRLGVVDMPALPSTASSPNLSGGAPVSEFLQLAQDEHVLCLVGLGDAEVGVVLGTADGVVKRVTPDYPLITDDENRIATSRKDYNDATQDYNTTRARFPTVISAKLFGFKEEPYFRAEEGAAQPPTINSNSLRQNPTK